jgi:hypothetical protein
MSQEAQGKQEVAHPYSPLAGFLSYLVPGLGQIAQGRTGKGLLFMVCLLSLFHVGQAMGNWQNVYVPVDENAGRRNLNPIRSIVNQRWHFAGQVWIGIAAWPALWQYYGGPVPDENVSKFWHNYQKQPRDEHPDWEVTRFQVNSEKKMPDLGWIYTVIAGMLNILVIYDAFAGPAYGRQMTREHKEAQPTGEVAAS